MPHHYTFAKVLPTAGKNDILDPMQERQTQKAARRTRAAARRHRLLFCKATT
jgi:hypothetical protein